MKNIFKTFIFGLIIVIASAAIITFGVGAFKGFSSIAGATGWAVVLYFVVGIACAVVALFGAFTIGSQYLSIKRYQEKKYAHLVCDSNYER